MANQNQNLRCVTCNKTFATIQGYKSHTRSKAHLEMLDGINNVINNEITTAPQELNNDKIKYDRLVQEYVEKDDLIVQESFSNHVLVRYTKKFDDETILNIPTNLFYDIFQNILKNYFKLIMKKRPFKFQISVSVNFSKPQQEETTTDTSRIHNFIVKAKNVITIEDVLDNLTFMESEINTRIEEHKGRESGLIIKHFSKSSLDIFQYHSPLAGTHLNLPFNSSVVINIKNKDEKCFLWCVIAHLHPARDHSDRLNNYNKKEYIDELNLTNITFPVNKDIIKLFNKQNTTQVNVYEVNKDGELTSVIITSHLNPKGCNLLLYSNGLKSHYVLCKDISVFMKHSRRNKNKAFPCLRCLTSYYSANALSKHLDDCVEHKESKAKFKKEEYLEFTKHYYKNKVPFTISCDFEAYNKIGSPNTKNYLCEQKAMCYGMYIHSNYPNLFRSRYISYYGEDCIEKFVKVIEKLQNIFTDLLAINIPMEEDIELPTLADKCFYCEKKFKHEEIQVKDHDHLNGKFRGYAHINCNLDANKFKYNFVPLYFYNGSKYDNHLFIKELCKSKELKKYKLKTLCKTDEEYIAIQIGCIRILDAFRFFVPYSLEAMGATLKPEECKILTEHGLTPAKGIYPYEYIKTNNLFEDINEIMRETRLPPIECYQSTLKHKSIEELAKDYETAQLFWDGLEEKTMYANTKKYLKIDVLILADLIEKFRDTCIKDYGIDPCYTYSLPGFTWIAGLKYTKVKLKYYKEDTYDILLFFEKGIRGGVSTVLGNRWVKCNNKKTNPHFNRGKIVDEATFEKRVNEFLEKGSNFDMSEEFLENFLLYYDANSLYPSAMILDLPTGEMEWSNNLNYNITTNNGNGYVYEVDLKYPEEIKEKTRYYSFCPENIKPNEHEFLNYQNKHKPNNYKPQEKLILNQNDKSKYVIEGRMLDWCLTHGMILTKIHRKLEYKKSDWLKSYIEFNIAKRTEAKKNKDNFGNTFYKLMNNAFYGKTLENVRNRQDVHIVRDSARFKWLASKPTYHRCERFDTDLAAVHMYRKSILQDKFNYIGFTILELSKLIMYQFVYDGLDVNFSGNYKLHYTDTDSIFFELTIPLNSTLDIEIEKIKDYIHPTDLCKFKNELSDDDKIKFIDEFIGLKAKCWAYTYYYYFKNELKYSGEEIKLKGITKDVQKTINFNNFKKTLFDNIKLYKDIYRLTSDKHEIKLLKQNKLALDPFYDKSVVADDGIQTFPYGYKKIERRSDLEQETVESEESEESEQESQESGESVEPSFYESNESEEESDELHDFELKKFY